MMISSRVHLSKEICYWRCKLNKKKIKRPKSKEKFGLSFWLYESTQHSFISLIINYLILWSYQMLIFKQNASIQSINETDSGRKNIFMFKLFVQSNILSIYALKRSVRTAHFFRRIVDKIKKKMFEKST